MRAISLAVICLLLTGWTVSGRAMERRDHDLVRTTCLGGDLDPAELERRMAALGGYRQPAAIRIPDLIAWWIVPSPREPISVKLHTTRIGEQNALQCTLELPDAAFEAIRSELTAALSLQETGSSQIGITSAVEYGAAAMPGTVISLGRVAYNDGILVGVLQKGATSRRSGTNRT
jgi:hypothetical protein